MEELWEFFGVYDGHGGRAEVDHVEALQGISRGGCLNKACAVSQGTPSWYNPDRAARGRRCPDSAGVSVAKLNEAYSDACAI